MIRNARVGQRVWSAILGYGTIIEICVGTKEYKIYCDEKPARDLPHTIKSDFEDDIWVNTHQKDREQLPREDFPPKRQNDYSSRFYFCF